MSSFYTPVQIGEETVGVRIAVRDMVKGTDGATPESQIYNWGIKKDASLDGGSHGPKVASSGVSSDASINSIPQTSPLVNSGSNQAEVVDVFAEETGTKQDRNRFSVLRTLESTDLQTVDPRLRSVLRDYGRHLQQLKTIESLQQKQQAKITQLHKAGYSANALQTAQRDLTKLEQMHAQQLQRLEKLEQKQALQKFVSDSGISNSQADITAVTDSTADAELRDFFSANGTDNLQAIVKRGTIKIQNGFASFPDGDPLNENIRHVIPSEGYFDVGMHGMPSAVCFGTTEANMSARLLANLIRHSDGYQGQKIRLLSCSTGVIINNDVCFAEELANALGVEVMAPNKAIYIFPDGELQIGKGADGQFITYKPNQRRRIK